MKKKLSLLLTGILCVGLLTGCTKTSNSGFAGTYWLENPANRQVEKGFYEKIEYAVTTEEEYEGKKITNLEQSGLYFDIDENLSSFVTELYEENGLYVYKTTLTMSGDYIFAGESVAVDDVTQTETVFKGIENGFACVKSVKKIKNTLPTTLNPTSQSQFTVVNATITTEYGEKNATHTLTTNDEKSKAYFSSLKEPLTVKRYNKKAFIENELMMLMARNFSYESSLNYEFSTIESATGELTTITIAPDVDLTTTSSESSSQSTAFKTLSVENCQIDDVIRTVSFNTFRLKFSTTGEYAQDFAYAYYANSLDSDVKDDHNVSRHYLVKCYKPALYNTCYMVYTLDRVTHVKPQ
ncbi:MAG: hypothetical protein IJW64_03750 [Clostridia bacterium]|nr:hypothetical protein [Clostridia bacterium]